MRAHTCLLLAAALLASLASHAPADAPEAARALAKEVLAAGGAARESLLAARASEAGAELVLALMDAGNELRRTNDLAGALDAFEVAVRVADKAGLALDGARARREAAHVLSVFGRYAESRALVEQARQTYVRLGEDRKSTRLNSSHLGISY